MLIGYWRRWRQALSHSHLKPVGVAAADRQKGDVALLLVEPRFFFPPSFATFSYGGKSTLWGTDIDRGSKVPLSLTHRGSVPCEEQRKIPMSRLKSDRGYFRVALLFMLP